VYGDHERYETTYFAPFPGYYFSGDGARRDADGYYWITGGRGAAHAAKPASDDARRGRQTCAEE
jgi:sugar lactone lactonase YvrE